MLYLLFVGELLDDSKAALLKVFLSQVRIMGQEHRLLQRQEWRLRAAFRLILLLQQG